MQRSSRLVLLTLITILAGCKQSTTAVYVDLDSVLKEDQPPARRTPSIPKPPATRPALVETVPGSPAVAIQDPANAPKQNVQEMFRAEQAKAFLTLQRRLRQFYEGEIQSFRLQQEESLSGEEQKAYEEANVKIRPLFDAWAKLRAPKFARLAILAGFPDPNPTSKPPDKGASKARQERAEEAKQIRIDLKRIDADFESASKTLVAAVLAKSAADQAALKVKIGEFATSLDKRAEDEARAQIRQAASELTFKLAEPTPIVLPATPARQVTIPAETPLDPAPEVHSNGILDSKADRRRLLERELQIWMALNRYTQSAKPVGHRNATQEFQKWRQQDGAGP